MIQSRLKMPFSAAVEPDILAEFKRLLTEVGPGLFWVALRSDSGTAEMEKTLQKELQLEPFLFSL